MNPSSPSTVYYLEMLDEADFCASKGIDTPQIECLLVDPPDPGLNCRFYASVGAQWDWKDRSDWSVNDWERYAGRDGLRTYLGCLQGSEIGYFELEIQESGNVQIVYFGLLPDYIGRGLGGELLSRAIAIAWGITGTKRVWLHTCTRDHPHALANYRARGFEIFKTEREKSIGVSD